MELLHWLCNVKTSANKDETVADNVFAAVIVRKWYIMNIELKKIDKIVSRKLAIILVLNFKIITVLCVIRIFSNVSVNLTGLKSSIYEFSVINLLFLPLEFGICVVVHEMGHYISAKKYGCAIKSIEINIKFLSGRTNIVNMEKLSRLRKIDVYFSGIMANLELWIVLTAMSNLENIFWFKRCREMGCLCSALIILNLIPVGATDGTEIIRMIRN